jgi:hypothetical protein
MASYMFKCPIHRVAMICRPDGRWSCRKVREPDKCSPSPTTVNAAPETKPRRGGGSNVMSSELGGYRQQFTPEEAAWSVPGLLSCAVRCFTNLCAALSLVNGFAMCFSFPRVDVSVHGPVIGSPMFGLICVTHPSDSHIGNAPRELEASDCVSRVTRTLNRALF